MFSCSGAHQTFCGYCLFQCYLLAWFLRYIVLHLILIPGHYGVLPLFLWWIDLYFGKQNGFWNPFILHHVCNM